MSISQIVTSALSLVALLVAVVSLGASQDTFSLEGRIANLEKKLQPKKNNKRKK